MIAYPIDATVPHDNGETPANGATRIRALAAAVTAVLTANHSVAADTFGEHDKVIFTAPITSPVAVGESKGELYVKDVSSKAELHFMNEDEKELQITTLYNAVAKILLDGGLLSNATYLKAKDAAGTTGTVDLIKAGRNEANDTDVAILPDKVRTATNAEPLEPTSVANRKYVLDQIAAINTPIIRMTEVVASNTAGTTLTANAWTKVGLTTEEIDTDTIASLSSGVITLPAGTYECHCVTSMEDVQYGTSRLRKTDGTAATLAVGTVINGSDGHCIPSIIDGYFVLTEESDIELQAWADDAATTHSAWNEATLGEQMIACSVYLRKVA